jgi:hypothetical protein
VDVDMFLSRNTKFSELNKMYCLFSKKGFHSDVEKIAVENNIKLVTLHNLYDEW